MNLEYKNSTIYYTVKGEGQTVVLLHGLLETTEMWNDLVSEFSKSNQVVCIDLLGHGKTECLGYVHTMEAMADAVFTVLNHLNIECATFIGHSMGGYVALALAEKHPKLFRGLCLMNSTFEADDNERKQIRNRAIKMAQYNFENVIRMSFTNLFAPMSKLKFQKEFDTALQLAFKTSKQGYIAAMEGMKVRKDRFNVFKNLNCSKLITISEKDNIVNGNNLIGLIDETNIQYEILSEGHMSHIENKSELTYILNRFIEK